MNQQHLTQQTNSGGDVTLLQLLQSLGCAGEAHVLSLVDNPNTRLYQRLLCKLQVPGDGDDTGVVLQYSGQAEWALLAVGGRVLLFL